MQLFLNFQIHDFLFNSQSNLEFKKKKNNEKNGPLMVISVQDSLHQLVPEDKVGNNLLHARFYFNKTRP